MTKIDQNMLNQKIGQRFKELIKQFDGFQEVTAKYLNYSKTSISRFCSGKEKLPDEAIKKVSKKWGIREEYLRCIDDFKTDLELLNFTELQNISDFSHQKKYLETLGFSFNLTYSLNCPKTTIYRHKEILLPYLREDSLKMLENDTDFLLPSKDFYQKCYFQEYLLFLKQPLTEEIKNSIGTIHKKSSINNHKNEKLPFTAQDCFFIPCTDSPIGVNCSINVYFSTYYNEKHIGNFNVTKIQELFKIIDAYTKCTIETFLLRELNN